MESCCFLPFPALPNSLLVRTSLIKSVVRSNEFKEIYRHINDTGHDLDLLLLMLCANKAGEVKLNFKPTYALLKHATNEQNKIKANPLYHLEVDRFILRSVIPSSLLTTSDICNSSFHGSVFSFSTFFSSLISSLKFVFKESIIALLDLNPPPSTKL